MCYVVRSTRGARGTVNVCCVGRSLEALVIDIIIPSTISLVVVCFVDEAQIIDGMRDAR